MRFKRMFDAIQVIIEFFLNAISEIKFRQEKFELLNHLVSGWRSRGGMGDNEPHTNGINGGGESDDEVNIHGSDGICNVSN